MKRVCPRTWIDRRATAHRRRNWRRISIFIRRPQPGVAHADQDRCAEAQEHSHAEDCAFARHSHGSVMVHGHGSGVMPDDQCAEQNQKCHDLLLHALARERVADLQDAGQGPVNYCRSARAPARGRPGKSGNTPAEVRREPASRGNRAGPGQRRSREPRSGGGARC